MAKFELNIYGENDEIVKQYATNICPWGVYIQAADMAERLEGKAPLEQLEAIGGTLKAVFRGLTNDELYAADTADVMSLFEQIVSGGQKIKDSDIKNAVRARG